MDRVLVQRIKAQEKTAAGIFIPEKAQETLPEAEVLAVGPGARDKDGKRIEMSVKPGDRVLLPSYGGNNVKIENEEYILIKEADILGKLED